jgi:hypothetical protein
MGLPSVVSGVGMFWVAPMQHPVFSTADLSGSSRVRDLAVIAGPIIVRGGRTIIPASLQFHCMGFVRGQRACPISGGKQQTFDRRAGRIVDRRRLTAFQSP